MIDDNLTLVLYGLELLWTCTVAALTHINQLGILQRATSSHPFLEVRHNLRLLSNRALHLFQLFVNEQVLVGVLLQFRLIY